MNRSEVTTPVGLVVARAQGDFGVHLAEPAAQRSLCGREVRTRPAQKSLREAGCTTCVTRALEAGHTAAREGDRTWINLARLQLSATG